MTETKIVERQVGINKKLAGVKFEDAFDGKTISDAEKTVIRKEAEFKNEVMKDFSALQDIFKSLNPENITVDDYNKINDLAFSIKSRASVAALPVASEVANSLYKFCDEASKAMPSEGYRILKLYFGALTEVFDNKFPQKDEMKRNRLINGLDLVSKKYIKSKAASGSEI